MTSHYGFVYSQPSQASQTVSDVAAGNRLKWEGTKVPFYKVAYPDGRQGYISKSISMPEKKNGGQLEAGRSQHYSYGA